MPRGMFERRSKRFWVRTIFACRRNLGKRSELARAPASDIALQFFGGGGGAEIAPVDAAMSSTAFRKLFHFAPPT